MDRPLFNTEQRILGLDAWRAALLLFVLPTHVLIGQEPIAFITMQNAASTTFSMGAFFLLSGYLAGLTMAKAQPAEWMQRRVRQIGVPLLFGLAITVPLIAIMVAVSESPWWAANGPDNLLLTPWHLWFLVALLVASAAGLLIERAGLVRLLERLPFSQASLFLSAVAVALAFRLASVLVSRLVSVEPLGMLAEASIGYTAFFLFGLILARSPRLRSIATAGYLVPLTGAAAMVLAYAVYYVALEGVFVSRAPAEIIIRNAICSVGPVAAGSIILKWSLDGRWVPPGAFELSRASYTMYLVQVPIIVALNLGFERLPWSLYAEYALCIVLATGLSYAVHKLLVEPFAVMRFLLNGREMAPGQRRPSGGLNPAR